MVKVTWADDDHMSDYDGEKDEILTILYLNPNQLFMISPKRSQT